VHDQTQGSGAVFSLLYGQLYWMGNNAVQSIKSGHLSKKYNLHVSFFEKVLLACRLHRKSELFTFRKKGIKQGSNSFAGWKVQF